LENSSGKIITKEGGVVLPTAQPGRGYEQRKSQALARKFFCWGRLGRGQSKLNPARRKENMRENYPDGGGQILFRQRFAPADRGLGGVKIGTRVGGGGGEARKEREKGEIRGMS